MYFLNYRMVKVVVEHLHFMVSDFAFFYKSPPHMVRICRETVIYYFYNHNPCMSPPHTVGIGRGFVT